MWALLFGLLPLARSQGVAVSAELSLEQNQLLPDEKMLLKLRVENRSGQDLKLGTESNWLTFTVLGEKNTVAAPLGTDQDYLEGETNVPAGMSASREFNLTPHFDFHQPGRYSVKATIRIPQWHQEIAVPAVTFTVVKGIRLANLPDLDTPVGVPFLQGRDNQPPEVRILGKDGCHGGRQALCPFDRCRGQPDGAAGSHRAFSLLQPARREAGHV